ncbi:lytic transglycosylase domain-containing protein [Candidatus Woesearchaeota archaeon]|nr:lytic transglycosylase domain-containing protein [Candidatus Woesearchaeota archaeon]
MYCPKSGVGKRKTGGLEIGLPGLKMFEIVSQKSDKDVASPTGCFEVQTEGKKGSNVIFDIEGAAFGIQERSVEAKEEPAPKAGIPEIQEFLVKQEGCTLPTKQYYVPENNLPVCLTENEAKKAFEPICRYYENSCLNESEIQKLIIKHITDLASNPSAAPHFQEIDDSIKRKIIEPKVCPAGTKNYGDPNLGEYLCLNDNEIKKEFEDRREIKKEPDSLVFKPGCSEGKIFDSDYGCIDSSDERIKKKIEEIERLERLEKENQLLREKSREKAPTEIVEDATQSCNAGSDRCSFDPENIFASQLMYFKERCIYNKDIEVYFWNFFDGYYTDGSCKEKIKPEPGVTVVQDHESAREKLRGQRRIKIEDQETAKSIGFGMQVAPYLIKNGNRPAVTLNAFVDELAAGGGNLGDVISAVADENDIDRTVIKSIISKESSFNVNAVSPVGAAGLMQLMPYTAKGLGLNNIYRGDEFNKKYREFTLGIINADTFQAFQKEYAADLRKQIAGKTKEELALFDDRFDPEKNLDAGVSYFARAYQYNKRDLGLALVTYNAGLGFVQKNCKGTYESCSLGANSPIRKYVDSISKEIASGGPVLDTREKILAFVNSVPKEKLLKDLMVLNGGDKKKAFEALGRMDIEPSFVQFSTYLKDAQFNLYSDPEKQGMSKSAIIQNPQFIPQGVRITADLPKEKVFGIFGGSYTIERSSTALPLWRLKDSKGNVVSGLDNKELFEIFTSPLFARGSINLPLGDEVRRFDIESDPKTKVRYFVDKKSKEKLRLDKIAEKIQEAKRAPEIRAPK